MATTLIAEAASVLVTLAGIYLNGLRMLRRARREHTRRTAEAHKRLMTVPSFAELARQEGRS